MTMTSLVFCLTLVAQNPTDRPDAASVPAAPVSAKAAPAARAGAPGARATTASTRAAEERAALIARRKASRHRRARAQAQRRATEAREEAARRDEEIKMAPVVANQLQMARLQLQEEQNAMTGQALANMQRMQAAQLATEQYNINMQYWLAQQPIRVIVTPPAPQQP